MPIFLACTDHLPLSVQESEAPLKAMLEVIAKSLIDRAHSRTGSAVPGDTPREDNPGPAPSGRSTPSLYKTPATYDHKKGEFFYIIIFIIITNYMY